MSNPDETQADVPPRSSAPSALERLEAILASHAHDTLGRSALLWADLKELIADEKAALVKFAENVKADV
jgi:hypothetical protein